MTRGFGCDDAEVAGDARRGERMVAGDHDGADAGTVRFGDGIAYFRARRVDDADHAGPDQIAFEHVALFRDVGDLAGGIERDARHVGERCGAERTVCLAECAVRFGRQSFDGREYPLAVALRHRPDGVAHGDAIAIAEQHVGSAFCE